MAKRRRMEAFKLLEISSVDRPAQAGAKAMIMKRKEPSPLAEVIAKRWIDPAAGAVTFSEAFETADKDQKYWAAMSKCGPYINALDTTLRSVVGDAGLTVTQKEAKIRDAVDSFLVKIREELEEDDDELYEVEKAFADVITEHAIAEKVRVLKLQVDIALLEKRLSDFSKRK